MRIVLLVGLSLLAGCAAPPPPPAQESGIAGTAMLGPTCPVQREPPDPQCADRPYRGDLVVSEVGERPVAQVTTKADGTFRVAVPPGNYTVRNPANATLPRCASDVVAVVAHAYARADVRCDTGIR